MEESKKSWTIFRVYLLIASIVGLIGSLVSVGILVNSIIENVVITDDEYINGQNYYELQQCKEGYYYGKASDANRRPTEEQKLTCEKEKKAQLALQRKVGFKETILGSGIWAIIFVILFATHYPKFKKKD